MLLSGIKTGKKKTRPPAVPECHVGTPTVVVPPTTGQLPPAHGGIVTSSISRWYPLSAEYETTESGTTGPSSTTAAITRTTVTAAATRNAAAADELRRRLSCGTGDVVSTTTTTTLAAAAPRTENAGRIVTHASALATSRTPLSHQLPTGGGVDSVLARRQCRLRATDDAVDTRRAGETANHADDSQITLVPLYPFAYSATSCVGSSMTLSPKAEADLTVHELVALETQHDTERMLDQEARNILRLNKKRKLKERASSQFGADSDEEDQRMQQSLRASAVASVAVAAHGGPSTLAHGSLSSRVAQQEQQHQQQQQKRDQHRQMGQYHRGTASTTMGQFAASCDWWLESPRFARFRLVALGNFVSLVMAPSHDTLTSTVGKHFYLVPLAPTPSLASCDDAAVWDEIHRFQTSLAAVFQATQETLIYFETVLPAALTNRAGSLWQTRLDAVAVPTRISHDVPLHFRQALQEQADEWGTHQKMIPITHNRPVYRAVPNKYPYFWVQWPNRDSAAPLSSTSAAPLSGYAQLIEGSSFPRDFGVDTIGGMLRDDPVRFRRRGNKQQTQSGNRQDGEVTDRRQVLTFLERWKHHDWTLQLDEEPSGEGAP